MKVRKGNEHRPPVVVVGCDAALSIIRSLGRKDIRVIVINQNLLDYGTKSKYCSVKLCKKIYDKPLIEILTKDVAQKLWGKAVLFGGTDKSVLTISKYEKELYPYFNFVAPSYDIANKIISKKLFYKFAMENDFLTPPTYFSHSMEDIEKIAQSISFPCIIKPEFRTSYWYRTVPTKVLYAETEKVFYRHFREFPIENCSLIIQEWIEGDDHDVFFCLTYINRGSKPLAVFTGRKIRQYPVLTGSTSFAESIWIPSIADESIRLLKKSGCIGFCSVEFKRSKEDQRFYVIEPTVGRPDTQEGISVSSGMDIPYVAYLDAIGENPEPLNHFKEGIKWINEPIDFYSIQSYLKNKNSSFKKLAVSYKGKRAYALWAIDDPLPFLSFARDKLFKGIGRLTSKIITGSRNDKS